MRRGSFRAAMLTSLLVAAVGCEERKPLPKLAELPDFQLTDRQGDPFEGADLDGKVWIADFIFTNCPTYCPVLTRKLSEVRERLSDQRGEVGFLSVSVDPEHDTPEALRQYAKEHDVAHEDWVFLTGDTERVTNVVVEGFKAPMGEPEPQQNGDAYTILHARHFVLVDGSRRIRGYYRTEPDQLDSLVDHVRRLASGEARQ